MNLPHEQDEFGIYADAADPAFRSAVWRFLVALYAAAFVIVAILGRTRGWW